MFKKHFDAIYYINLVKDTPAGTAKLMSIYGQAVKLVQIPAKVKLSEYMNETLKDISTHSKVYFMVHAVAEVDRFVSDRLATTDKEIYSVNDVATFLANHLTHSDFHSKDNFPRLTLVLDVCEGYAFAKKLQNILANKYSIYVDVIAKKFISVHHYEVDTKTQSVNIAARSTVIRDGQSTVENVGMFTKRPHSKVILIWDKQGEQQEIDAYELEWIGRVQKKLNKHILNYKKWSMHNDENLLVLKSMQTILSDINFIVMQNIGMNINETANLILAYLLGCLRDDLDKSLKPAKNYESFLLFLKDIVAEGFKFVTPNASLKEYLNKMKLEEWRHARLKVLECSPRIYITLVSRHLDLLEQASTSLINNLPIEEALEDEIKKVDREIGDLRKISNPTTK